MTVDHLLPAAGGSYIRQEDGSLVLIDPGAELTALEVQSVPPPAAPKPTVKRGVKAPQKEG